MNTLSKNAQDVIDILEEYKAVSAKKQKNQKKSQPYEIYFKGEKYYMKLSSGYKHIWPSLGAAKSAIWDKMGLQKPNTTEEREEALNELIRNNIIQFVPLHQGVVLPPLKQYPKDRTY